MTYKAWKKEVDRLFSEREESLESYSFDWHKAHEYGLSPMEAVVTAAIDDWFDNLEEADDEDRQDGG